MITQKAIQVLKQASAELSRANNELNRPQEDVVSFVVCQSTRRSIINLLRSYLHFNKVDPGKTNDLQGLLKQCRALDNSFNKIDLSAFSCKAVEECDSSEVYPHTKDLPSEISSISSRVLGSVGVYCLSVEKVRDCFLSALEIKRFVFDKLGVVEDNGHKTTFQLDREEGNGVEKFGN